MSKLKWLGSMTAMMTAIGMVATSYWQIDARYAKAMDLTKLEQRVLMSELSQSYRDAWTEVLYLRKQLRKYPTDKDIKDQLEESEIEWKRLKELVKKEK